MTCDRMKKEKEDAYRRMRTSLDKPLPVTHGDISDEFFDPWDDLVDGMVGSYNSEIDRIAIAVLEAIRDGKTFELLRSKDGLAAEIMMHVFSDWMCDYGTSPRGLFPFYGLESMWDELIAKWKAYAEVTWGD